jgi:hypothetical protein
VHDRAACTEKQNKTVEWFAGANAYRGLDIKFFTEELYFDVEDLDTPLKEQTTIIKKYTKSIWNNLSEILRD